MIALYICLGVVGAFLLFYGFPNLLISGVLYQKLLVRTNKKKWSRECSWDDEEQREMFARGEAWGRENAAFHRSVSVKSGRLRLAGEYFDFGFRKAVIIVPGRMETCVYSYFFAQPYKKMGYNVLAIDNRAHGLSEGKYNTLGMKEYKDLLAWAEFLHTGCGVEKVWFHGICIGAATALNAFTSKNAPDWLEGLTSDGVYLHFKDMLIKRTKARGHLAHPVAELVMFYLWLVSGKDPARHGPIHCIGRMKKPMLFFYSKEDIYTDPAAVQTLFERCASPQKEIDWFEKGVHSHLRINDEARYDALIENFLKSVQ